MTALLLNAMQSGYSASGFVVVLLGLVAVAAAAWWGRLRLLRKKEQKALVFAGAIVLAVALALSLVAFQLLVWILADLV